MLEDNWNKLKEYIEKNKLILNNPAGVSIDI